MLFFIRNQIGEQMMAIPGALANMQLHYGVEQLSSFNLFAETVAGSDSSVVMVGAHLDSVSAGPGINDNGSGSAAVLELALLAAKRGDLKRVKNKVRFAWWGLEELGLHGSMQYLLSLNETELRNIMAYVNADMIASPNYVLFISNASEAVESARIGTARLQTMMETYIASVGASTEVNTLYMGSDQYCFALFGIPTTLLIGGAGDIKTKEQRDKFGGMANAPFDACYHRDCDDTGNINTTELSIFGASLIFTRRLSLPNKHVLSLSLSAFAARAMGYAMRVMWRNENLRAEMRPDTNTATTISRRTGDGLAATPSNELPEGAPTYTDIMWAKVLRAAQAGTL